MIPLPLSWERTLSRSNSPMSRCQYSTLCACGKGIQGAKAAKGGEGGKGAKGGEGGKG